MKLIPNFEGDSLVLIGHGFFPWLYSVKYIFNDQFMQEIKRFGKTNKSYLPKDYVNLKFDGINLFVMDTHVKAQVVLAHQLNQWLLGWKNND